MYEVKNIIIEGLNIFQTVEENKKCFRKRQYKRASSARNIYDMVGAPILRNLKLMIRQIIIHNFPVMVEYIEIADNIVGPDVSTMKGRKRDRYKTG